MLYLRSLNKRKMCATFFRNLVTGYCLYLVKISILNWHPFSSNFFYLYAVAKGLKSREICGCSLFVVCPEKLTTVELVHRIHVLHFYTSSSVIDLCRHTKSSKVLEIFTETSSTYGHKFLARLSGYSQWQLDILQPVP